MHKIYLAWFRWGFWSKFAMLAVALILGVLHMAKKPVAKIVGAVSVAIYMANSIIWLAFGAIWRFSLAG